MANINNLIQASLDGEPVAVSDAFGELMSSRIAAKIDSMVPDVAGAIFTPSSEE